MAHNLTSRTQTGKQWHTTWLHTQTGKQWHTTWLHAHRQESNGTQPDFTHTDRKAMAHNLTSRTQTGKQWHTTWLHAHRQESNGTQPDFTHTDRKAMAHNLTSHTQAESRGEKVGVEGRFKWCYGRYIFVIRCDVQWYVVWCGLSVAWMDYRVWSDAGWCGEEERMVRNGGVKLSCGVNVMVWF